MLIAQITDIHVGFDRSNPDEYNTERLKAVIARLINAPTHPDLLLMTGDLTEFGDAQSYKQLAQIVAVCPFPVWPMVGNHDTREPLLAAFPQTPSHDGFIQYALDWNGVRLLLLDTFEPGRHGGAFCKTRADWLEAQLAAHPDTPTIITMHHPPFESGIAWLDGDANEPWIALFAQTVRGHGQIKSILAGHLHRIIHTFWQGMSLTVCASTAPLVGLDLRPIDSEHPDGRPMITDELPVFALHRWDGERLISHFQGVSEHAIFARFDDNLQAIVKHIEGERPSRGD